MGPASGRVSVVPKASSAESDIALMRRVQAGDAQRFSDLIRRYQAPLLRVAASRLGRQDAAEEVVQETFLAAFKSRHTYDEQYSFRTWLWTILLNQCRSYLRSRRRTPRVSPWSDAAADGEGAMGGREGQPSGEPAPLGRLMAQERRELLEQLLGRLTDVQADALRLRFFGELKFHEIAETMNCSLPTAKNRVRNGLLRLAEMLRDEAPQGAAVASGGVHSTEKGSGERS